eukprot:gene12304-20464_t
MLYFGHNLGERLSKDSETKREKTQAMFQRLCNLIENKLFSDGSDESRKM